MPSHSKHSADNEVTQVDFYINLLIVDSKFIKYIHRHLARFSEIPTLTSTVKHHEHVPYTEF